MLLEPHGGQEDVKGRGARRNLGTAQPRETGSLPKAPQEGTGLGESEPARADPTYCRGRAEVHRPMESRTEQGRAGVGMGWGGIPGGDLETQSGKGSGRVRDAEGCRPGCWSLQDVREERRAAWGRAEGLPEEGEVVGMRTPVKEALEAPLPASLRTASEQRSPGSGFKQGTHVSNQRGVRRGV